ncbi:MAG: hypothetical protein ABW278_02605 [Steroidobacteraceae bacterium]
MKMRARFIALLLCACVGIVRAAEWQVVMLKPQGCINCLYLEEILKRGAQLRTATLADSNGGQVSAPILRRSSAALSAQEWAELRALPYFDEAAWQRQVADRSAQILLKRDGLIAAAGDIAESVDMRGVRFPDTLNMPATGQDPAIARDARVAYLRDLYLNSWNLNWFYQLALDPSLHRTRSDAAWIASQSGTLVPPLDAANVLLVSTATGAADNEIFNALRIEEIREVLAGSLALAPSQLRIFYGGGPGRGANALEVRGGRIGLVRRDVTNATPFTPETALRTFQSIRARPASRNLLVLIGHGNPDGAGMWGSPTALAPATLRALHQHGGGDDVLVSGNCYGGVMAQALSCGFFGARPDLIATGCQADAAVVAESRDYLHMFFSSLTPALRTAADADGDGEISFAEAHWHASTESDPRNVTYSSVDALADGYFAAHPEALPPTLTVAEIRNLAAAAPPAEGKALRRLVEDFNPVLAVPLGELAQQAEEWGPGSYLPRVLAGQLTRRVLFLQSQALQGVQNAELARLQSCENRAVSAFLKP